jgi:hypothetical protein
MKRPVTAIRTPTNVKISSRDHDGGDSSRVKNCVVLLGGIEVGAAWTARTSERTLRLMIGTLVDILEDVLSKQVLQGCCT